MMLTSSDDSNLEDWEILRMNMEGVWGRRGPPVNENLQFIR